MKEERLKQILILAPELLGETLSTQLSNSNKSVKAVQSKEELKRHPSLIIWSIDNAELPGSIDIELTRLKNRWSPSPLLLIIPEIVSLSRNELLQFNCAGLLQNPDFQTLNEAVSTLLEGGRVVRINDSTKDNKPKSKLTLGFGQWLLISGLQQINDDLEIIKTLLDPPPQNPIALFILLGRQRELNQAKSILNFLWGPIRVSIKAISTLPKVKSNKSKNYDLEIDLKKRDSLSVWQEIYSRIDKSIEQEVVNSTGNLLAIESLKPLYMKEILISLLYQLDEVFNQLRNLKEQESESSKLWSDLQTKIRQQAIRSAIGSYIRLPFSGESVQVVDELLSRIDLTDIDQELPEPESIIDPLILKKPLLIDGQFIALDDPRALIHLEIMINNWLIRTAEIISAELISISSKWPEFRNYILNKQYISTRELERLRNQLNSQKQMQDLIKRPVRLYESKRLLYTLNNNQIESIIINESRDLELLKLTWLQQQVALLVEAKDAIAPQLQSLIKYLGNLMVILLTKVIGRAIGLVGKGIAQGMGRSLTKG